MGQAISYRYNMRLVMIIRCCVTLYLVYPFLCAAVEPYEPIVGDPLLEPWRWRKVDELSGLKVLSMDQDSEGVCWFGGIGCIGSYDGLIVKRIDLDEDLMSMIVQVYPRPRVRSILCMEEGRILALIGRSLVLREEGSWRVIIQDTGFAHMEADLQQAEDGSIWLMTRKNLWWIREDLSGFEKVAGAAGNALFKAFCFGQDDRIWLAQHTEQQRADLIEIPMTEHRLLSEIQWAVHRVPVEQPGAEAGIACGVDGKVWYGDKHESSGFYAFDPENRRWEELRRDEGSLNCFSLTRFRDGIIWAGGTGNLAAIRDGQIGYYTREQLNLPSTPLSLHETKDGRWWVLGRIGHVYYLDRSYNHWKTYRGLHYECETPDGIEWFIEENGWVVSHNLKSGEWLRYDSISISLERARNITSHEGLIWVTGRREGRAAISVFDGQEWTPFFHPEFALDMSWDDVMISPESTLWFGAGGQHLMGTKNAGGILEYGVNKEGRPYLVKHHAPPVVPYHVRASATTSDGARWFGAPTIHRWGAEAEQAVPVLEVPQSTTYDLVVDEEDSVWLTKLGFGLFLLRADREKWVSMNEGLPSANVYDLQPLLDGTLMATTDKGISRFDGKSWASRVFSEDFAMAGGGGRIRQSPDGALWFNFREVDGRSAQVLINGQNRFSTTRYVGNREPPETEIMEYMDRVSPPGNVYISWSGRDVFARTASDMLQFSWRFNGGEWSPFTDENGRTFLNLSGGNYKFEVRARDHDFNVDPSPARISFLVLPPVWQQGWFVMMVGMIAALIVLLIWMFIRHREHRLQIEKQQIEARAHHLAEIDQLKSGFFTNISHELNTPLTLILGPLERVLKKEQDESKRTLLNQALRNVQRVMTLTTQLMDFRRLEMGKLSVELLPGDAADCISETVEMMKPLADAKGVGVTFHGLETLPGMIDEDKLRKIVQNLVGNGIKYTPQGGEVRVCVASKEGLMELAVEDTGRGIAPEYIDKIFERFYRVPEKQIVDGSGIGLNLTKGLVEIWGGRISVDSPAHDSDIHPGSRFRVVLPIELNKEDADV